MKAPGPAAFAAAGFSAEESVRRADLAAVVGDLVGVSTDTAWYHVPGRIEVLGKHTDYAGGRSLVCATEQGIVAAASPRPDPVLRVTDAARRETVECPLAPDAVGRRGHWSNYPATVAARLSRDFGPGLQGVDLVLAGDLPLAAGLSSSSTLVIAVALALIDRNALSGSPAWAVEFRQPEQLAGYLGAVENGRAFGSFAGGGGVGTLGGSQDHTAILAARPGSLTQCRFDPAALEHQVAWPDDLTFLVATSGVIAEKTGAALERYNGLARTAARLSGLVANDRSIGRCILDSDSPAALARELRGRLGEDDPGVADHLAGRLAQLVAECTVFIPGMVAAIEAGNHAAIGEMAAASHEAGGRALRNLVVETRALVEMALDVGALGASAFGAGFGGSVWAIAATDEADRILDAWRSRYVATFPERLASAAFLVTRPGPPATRIVTG